MKYKYYKACLSFFAIIFILILFILLQPFPARGEDIHSRLQHFFKGIEDLQANEIDFRITGISISEEIPAYLPCLNSPINLKVIKNSYYKHICSCSWDPVGFGVLARDVTVDFDYTTCSCNFKKPRSVKIDFSIMATDIWYISGLTTISSSFIFHGFNGCIPYWYTLENIDMDKFFFFTKSIIDGKQCIANSNSVFCPTYSHEGSFRFIMSGEDLEEITCYIMM